MSFLGVTMTIMLMATAEPFSSINSVSAFAPYSSLVSTFHTSFSSSSSTSYCATTSPKTQLHVAPKRLDGNIEGPLYVNEKCINCAACAMFAPASFQRNNEEMKHNVYHRPSTDDEIEQARAALSACLVAAIRVETSAYRNHNNLSPMTQREESLTKELAISPKFNGRPVPFPRPVAPLTANQHRGVWFVGHHNEASFGATPYVFYSTQEDKWIMIDTPKFSKSAVQAVESITDGRQIDYLILTHVDDTAGHNDWKDHYPNLQRVFHTGDLGRHNWIGDSTLEHVEVLLSDDDDDDDDKAATTASSPLPAFDIRGQTLTEDEANEKEVVIYHTPGHSPGSISILFRGGTSSGNIDDDDNDETVGGVLFTGDTYSYRLSSDKMTGFPRYGNNRQIQAQILPKLLDLDWSLLAPGHGHYRDYSMISNREERRKRQQQEMEAAIEELAEYGAAIRR
jgi:glyoxylase-like metal-dependent hydrolase (beta-lactamase superfamily II)/ferredoxin